jgi:hypothetical protein
MAEAEATVEPAEAEPVELEAPADADAEAAAPEPEADAGGKAKKPAKEPRKPRKGKSPEAGEEGGGDDVPSIAAHPRATRSVARAKSWGALGGFLLGGYLSLPTHTLASAGLRALVAGTVCYVAAWAGAVFFWRRMVPLEISSRQEQMVREAESLQARHQAAASQGAQAAARAQAAAQLAQESPPRR